VTWQLGQYAIDGLVPALIVLAALVLLFKTQINPAWLVIGGGIVGLISQSLWG
jgi:mannose/fructose/N-acetylgalactosamine-specific phosphotransferase system component IID